MKQTRKFILIISILLTSTVLLFLFSNNYYFPFATQVIDSLVIVLSVYSVKFIIDNWIASKIFEKRAQFSFRRFIDVISAIALALVLLSIWVEDPTTLIVSSGILGAGIAIALQDLFRNLAGGLLAMFSKVYKIGDRIEVDGNYGDVLDVGLFNTTMMEIKEWIDGDQATGRICVIPNGVVLSGIIHNYSKEFNYIWDEIIVPITYDSNWKVAYEKLSKVVQKQTKQITTQAKNSLKGLGSKYYLTARKVDPSIFITLTDNWIEFKVRYITEIKNRRAVSTKISRLILEEIEKTSDVNIASSTLSVSGKLDLTK